MSVGSIRPAAVAGTFYPAPPEVLRRVVYGFLEEATREATREAARRAGAAAAAPKALIVPHAGYVYSGAVAASGYARVRALAGKVSRVVLLGPCHRVAVRGLALPDADAFETPLGRIEIDQDAVAGLSGFPHVVNSGAAHAKDHALEVQLPFLQQVLGKFKLVPFLVGEVAPEAVAQVLERLWGGNETLIVISSDLSHYLPYERAQCEDRKTVEAMLALADPIDHHHACGATPVNALMQVARRRGLRPELLDLRNSGDTAGDRGRVVGYAALALHEPTCAPARRSDEQGTLRGPLVTGLARAAIGHRFGQEGRAREDAAFLREPGASFITLKLDGRLRGCIGSLAAHRPLGVDIEHNACAAAFADPRFAPLSANQFDAVRIEVSLLSVATPLVFKDQAEVLAQLRPQIDGIVFEHGARRATFLPQVWEALPDPRDFLAQLKVKAGLPGDFWAPGMRVSRYTVEKWAES